MASGQSGQARIAIVRTEPAVVYCLLPFDDGCSVRMEVLSCHPKVIDQKSISRRNLSYFARMCLYQFQKQKAQLSPGLHEVSITVVYETKAVGLWLT